LWDGDSLKGVVRVPPTRPPYPPEFKEEAMRLMRSSAKPLAQISRELDVSEQTLRNCRKQQDIDEGEREGLTTEEKEELARLRRENKVLRQEREILKKPTASSPRWGGRDPRLTTPWPSRSSPRSRLNGHWFIRHQGDGEDAHLRQHRRLLQSKPQALLDRIHESF
jgi:transposase